MFRPNSIIGAYQCKLCKIEFEDAFCLARHRCACIVLLEYRCPECSKKFSCPANLSSHRRWHFKPKDGNSQANRGKADSAEAAFDCTVCKKSFKRLAYLKKHQTVHESTQQAKKRSEKGSKRSNENSAPVQKQPAYADDDDILIPKTVLSFSQNSSHSDTTMTSNSSSLEQHDGNSGSCTPTTTINTAKFKVLGNNFTEDENIAISALANLFGGHNKSTFVRVGD